MKVMVFIVLLLASFAGALPSQPCSILNYAIICSGHQVNDDSLLKLIEQIKIGYAHMHFAQLIITETEITHIPADAFSDCTFESILVEGNAHLSTVHEQSFSVQQHCKSLVIINNALLTDNNIFKLVQQMNLLEDVDFEFNHLNEIPSNAFGMEAKHNEREGMEHDRPDDDQPEMPHRKLTLKNNHIGRIHSNAFRAHLNFKEIFLNFNGLTHIESGAFNLSTAGQANRTAPSHDKKDSIEIYLDHNKLTGDSFSTGFMHVNDDCSIWLSMTNNQVGELKQSVFQPLLDQSVTIDLLDNHFDCKSSHNQWIVQESKYSLKVKNTECW